MNGATASERGGTERKRHHYFDCCYICVAGIWLYGHSTELFCCILSNTVLIMCINIGCTKLDTIYCKYM